MNDYDEAQLFTTAPSDWERGESPIDAIQLMERRVGNPPVATRPVTSPRQTLVVAATVERRETLREKLERQREEVATAIGVLTTQLAKREAQLRELDRYPAEDPYKDGDSLEFRKQYPGSDTKYHFLAVRANGLWYTTGNRGPQGVPWAKFTEWMGLGVTDIFKIGATRKTAVRW